MKNGEAKDYIYSWKTYGAYLKHGCYFAKWAQKAHGCRTLAEARAYVDEYLINRIERGLSPYTQKLDAAAIAKIYGCSTRDFVKTQNRYRAGITRSRGSKARDRHFSEKRNREFVDFCKATGLRRCEIRALTRDKLEFDESKQVYYLNVIGKGGRPRKAPVLSQEAVARIQSAGGKVWPKAPGGADIHAYRADYCMAVYMNHARPVREIPAPERYCCRKDLKGTWYDKKAMKIASQALGHDRISVIAGHYIRGT
jgi:integrase